MTQAENFHDALAERWANDQSRHAWPRRSFFDGAVEVYLQEYEMHWGREVSGFDPDDTKELGRWLAKCVAEARGEQPEGPTVCPTCGNESVRPALLTGGRVRLCPDSWHGEQR